MYVEAPNPLPYPGNSNKRSVFLAGGITDCPDWQFGASILLDLVGYDVFNPRRMNFPIDDPNAAEEQITWEFNALNLAYAIIFWFPEEEIQPIALFELGRWTQPGLFNHVTERSSKMYKPVAIGVDPSYERRQDVEIQVSLARPNLVVHYKIDDVIADIDSQVKKFYAML